MNVKIYQLDPVRASNNAVTCMRIDISTIPADAYNLVFSGNVDCEKETELCAIFGARSTDHRALHFHGHGLRTNDLIEVEKDGSRSLYQYEQDDITDGRLVPLAKVYGDLNTAKDIQHCVIGVFAEPGKFAHIQKFDLRSDVLRNTFGLGYDILQLSEGRHCICCGAAVTHCNIDTVYGNDMNRLLCIDGYEKVEISAVRGPVFFCDVRMDKQTENIILHSLNARECQELLRQYRLPERFYEYNGEIRSIPYYPSSCIMPYAQEG